MDDLETLRPEVAEAIRLFGAVIEELGLHDDYESALHVLCAELLRLTAENASMRAAWHDALLTGTGILKVERVDPATVMLPVAPRQGKDTPVPQSEHEALTERAEKAEAELATLKNENAQLRDVLADRDMDREMAAHAHKELAAMKARIAQSAHVEVTLGCAIDGEIPPDLALCKLALVKMEDGDV